jgi:hypothetical protein
MLNWIQVQSSAISAVAYEDASSTLYIKFVTNSSYKYYNVPRHVYEALESAASLGMYFNQNIKYVYEWDRVN